MTLSVRIFISLLMLMLLLAGTSACRRPVTSKGAMLTAPPTASSSLSWRTAWTESALTKIEKPTINVSGRPGSWQVELRLHVERAAPAKPYDRVVLYLDDSGGVPFARLQHLVELPLLLRSSPDGQAIAFSADNGKRWRMVRFDLLTKENEPVYCVHYAFAGEIPSLETTVIDMLGAEHETKHAWQMPPGESQHVLTEEEKTDQLLGFECPLQPTGCNASEIEAVTAFSCGPKGAAIESVALAYARNFVSRRRGRDDPTCMASLATRWPNVKKVLFDAVPDESPTADPDQRIRILDAREKVGKP